MIEREDLVGENLAATLKVVGGEELRTRLRPGPMLQMHTKAVHVTKSSRFGWQGQFHRHLLQVERYLVVQGRLAAVSWVGGTVAPHGNVYNKNAWFSFAPGIWHDVLTTSDAEFVTVQVAEPEVDVEHDREVMVDIPAMIRHEMAMVTGMLIAT